MLLNQIPRVSNSRSLAQRIQTVSLHALRPAYRQHPTIAEAEQAQILQLNGKVKDLPQELKNK